MPVDVQGLKHGLGLVHAHLGQFLCAVRHHAVEHLGDGLDLGLEELGHHLLHLRLEPHHGLPLAVDGPDDLLGLGNRRGLVVEVDLHSLLSGFPRLGGRFGGWRSDGLAGCFGDSPIGRGKGFRRLRVQCLQFIVGQGLQSLLFADLGGCHPGLAGAVGTPKGDLEDLRLDERVDLGFSFDPVELQIGLAEVDPDHLVQDRLAPLHERHQALFHGLVLLCLARAAVHGPHQRRGGHAEREGHHAGQPVVQFVLEDGLLDRHRLGVARDADHLPELGGVPRQDGIEDVLEFLDLGRLPTRGTADQHLGDRAFGVVLEERGLTPDRDVDGDEDLFDRAVAVDFMHPGVPGRIDQLIRGVIHGGHALQDLLVSGVRRHRRAAGHIQHALDRGAVDEVETVGLAPFGHARADRGRVHDEHLLVQHPAPLIPVVLTIGECQEVHDLLAPFFILRLALLGLDLPFQAGNLILPGLDHQPHDVKPVRQRLEVREGDGLTGAGRVRGVDADGVVQLTAKGLILGQGLDRLARAHPHARIARAPHDPTGHTHPHPGDEAGFNESGDVAGHQSAPPLGNGRGS